MANKTSILHVLEEKLGKLTPKHVNALDSASIEDLANAVNDYYQNWEYPELGDELSMYAGGWVAGNLEAAEARQYLYTTLVYYPRTIIHDPVAEWFYSDRLSLNSPPIIKNFRGDGIEMAEPALIKGDGYFALQDQPERTKQRLLQVLPFLTELAPLINAGIVIPVPQWKIIAERQKAILSAIRHDIANDDFVNAVLSPVDEPPTRSDHIRGLFQKLNMQTVDEANRSAGQAVSYFLNKTIALSDYSQSMYVPPTATDAKLLDVKVKGLEEALRTYDVDLQVAPSLISTELPFIGNVDVKTILDIRKNERAFADWRAELRTSVRAIRSQHSQGKQFTKEAQDVLQDSLAPKAEQIKKAISTSTFLKKSIKDPSLTFAVGAGTLASTAALTAPAVSALAIGSTAHWLLKMLFHDSPIGSNAVLATLVRKGGL